MSFVPRAFGEAKIRELPERFAARVKSELVPDFARLWARASTPREVDEVNVLWSAEVERIGAEVLAEVLAELREYAVEGSA